MSRATTTVPSRLSGWLLVATLLGLGTACGTGSSTPEVAAPGNHVAPRSDLTSGTPPVSATEPADGESAAEIAFDPQDDYEQYDAGCVSFHDPGRLNEQIGGGLGPLVSWDAPRPLRLADGRQFWIVQDAYLDWPEDGPLQTLRQGQGANNLAIAFDQQGCGTILTRPMTPNGRMSFEYGVGDIRRYGYFWPLGISERDDAIWIYWALMIKSESQPNNLEGIIRHPVGTYLASYDSFTLERLSFQPAPEPGVEPQWGFDVVSDESWTYLYGNDNVLNLAMSGGYDAGPHPSTEMFVGRVPLKRFEQQPAVWDGSDWNPDHRAAVPFSSRMYFSNQMRPIAVDDYFVSVTAADEFWDEEMIVEVALAPQGPWHEVARHDLTIDTILPSVSYHPVILPEGPDGELIALVSYNAADWPIAVENPEYYRPYAIELDRQAIELKVNDMKTATTPSP